MNPTVMPASHVGTTPSFQMRSMGVAAATAAVFVIFEAVVLRRGAARSGRGWSCQLSLQQLARENLARGTSDEQKRHRAFRPSPMGAPAILHHPPAGSTPGRFATTVEMDAATTSGALDAADDEGHDEAYVAYELAGVRRGFTLTPPHPSPPDPPARASGVMILFHTYVPPPARGRKLAERLVETAFAWADANGLRVRPECTYVAALAERTPHLAARLER